MTPDRLLSHFERLVNAPNAIPRLRQLILELAVRGKLVEQVPSDEPATRWLGPRQLDVTAPARPWSLPKNWAWSSFELIGEAMGGGTPSKANPNFWQGRIPWVSPKDMKVEKISDSEDHISEGAIEQSSTRLIPVGSLLMVVRGMILAHSFPTAITTVPVTINQDMKAIVPFCADIAPILLLISKGIKTEVLKLVKHSTHGTCKLLTDELFQLPLPIPPLAEQKRIVAKVDELMALCDRLEAAQAERESRRDRLAAASLQRLNQPADAPAFREHARFHLSHLQRLTTRPEQIKQFRQTILNLAVRGQLTIREPNEEPASQLLARFGAQKAREGGTKTGRDWLSDLNKPVAESFVVPDGWVWTRIANTAQRITVGYVGPMKDHYVKGGVPFLRSQNVRANQFREEGLITISREFHESISKSALSPGDVVVVRSGNIGTACVVPPSLPEANCSDLVVVKSPVAVLPAYLCFYLNSLAAHHIEAGAVGVALTHFNTRSVAVMPLPLPPLAEQHRIVAKVDELMGLCDRLEAQLTTTQTRSRLLLEAVLHEALAGA